MTRFETFLTKIRDLFKDYCEFRKSCPYFDPDGHTCTRAGGLHCGKHRQLKAEKENSPKK